MQVEDLKIGERALVAGGNESSEEHKDEASDAYLVSFLADIPAPLQAAMTTFIERHPNWDQYRLIQAAISGFLVQNGVESRKVTRLYLDNMFCSKSFG